MALVLIDLLRLPQLLLPLLLLSTLPAGLSGAPCHPDDKRALQRFWTSVGLTWNFGDDCCSDWPVFTVGCDAATGRITSLYLSDIGFSGHIPPTVGDLPPTMETLSLRKSPNLTGPVPPEITRLTNLRFLHLDWNSLTGPVPAFLGRMTSLEDIVLSFNKLSGSIPASLGDLPRLRGLYLDRNQLTGNIPASLGRLRVADGLYLRLSHNRLTGSVPRSFGNLNISQIDLSRNQLTGDPSVLFRTGDWAPPTTAIFIDLSRNHFEFDLSGAEFSASLGALDLSHNQVYGGIPAQLAKLQLQLFNVSYNRLCGEIPQGGRLGGFTEFEFFHNRCLCGNPLTPCK